jgi:fibronectin type 3 domain-containing protein
MTRSHFLRGTMKRIPLIATIFLLLFWPSAAQVQHGCFLSWSAPTGGAASYNVYRSNLSGGPYILLANVTTTSFVDPISNLAPGKTYFYVVTSVNSIGVESANSNEASGTLPLAPGVPQALVDAIR